MNERFVNMTDKVENKKENDKLRKNLEQVTPFLRKDDAVIRLNNKKTLIATDIHGNAGALDFIMDYADKRKVDAWVFLGDYVDKGPESVRVLNTLLELKCKHPKKVFLLRGNHETKDVNQFYEFGASMMAEPDIHSAANSVFENMPTAAILNDSIFCVHGGISGKKDENVKDINKQDSFYYLWNDPCEESGLTPSPRGGKVRRFGPDTVKKFLKNNDLKLIIRGHSTLENGLKFWFDHTLVSLYSSLPYADPELKAAVAIVDGNGTEFCFYRRDDSKKAGFAWEEMTVSLTIPDDSKKKKKEK
ncbi:MAG: serine/threonine protein phosphatase [Methanimicrococcus sp.]|nr:serine/threonine protein phosphatase [Methanimicrococcus sp.]